METNTTQQPLQNGSETEMNPLSMTNQPTIPEQPPTSLPIEKNAEGVAQLQNQAAPLTGEQVIIPPTPLPTQNGISENAPTKSSALGITIGIVLLIAITVGGSLYYYFFVYKKEMTVVQAVPTGTLIKKNEPVATTTTSIPVPPAAIIDESVAIDAEIQSAEQDKTLSGDSLTAFTNEVK